MLLELLEGARRLPDTPRSLLLGDEDSSGLISCLPIHSLASLASGLVLQLGRTVNYTEEHTDKNTQTNTTNTDKLIQTVKITHTQSYMQTNTQTVEQMQTNKT